VDHDTLVAQVEQALRDGGWSLDAAAAPRARRDPHDPALAGVGATGVELSVHRAVEQANVVVGGTGLSATDDRRFTLSVLSAVLGGGMSSRLFQEIREKRGLAYSTYSYASSYTDAGLVGAYVGTSPGKVDEALAVLREELARVPDDVTEAEVERARGALKGGTVLSLEDTGSRMSRIGKQVATGAPIVTVDDALTRIAEVTVDD